MVNPTVPARQSGGQAQVSGEDWRLHQARSVREALTAPSKRSWIAQANGRARGFVVATTADAESTSC